MCDNTKPGNITLELYKIKSETFRFYCNHYRLLVLLYLTTVGAILNFSLTKSATKELFYSLMIIGIFFTIVSEVAIKIHHGALYKLEKSISIITEVLLIVGHEDDCENFSKALQLLSWFNFIIFLIFCTLPILKSFGLLV